MITPITLITIILMGLTTYWTRLAGYLLLEDKKLSPRIQKVMEAAPGCVLIAVIAPHFVSGKITDIISLAIIILCSMRFGLLGTVLAGVISAGLLRQFF